MHYYYKTPLNSIFFWHTSCYIFCMKDKKITKAELALLEQYIETASPYPTVEEFCLLNDIDYTHFYQWKYDDNASKLVKKLYLKAYTILDKFLTIDTKTIQMGSEGKWYKLDKKGIILNLEKLEKLLNN